MLHIESQPVFADRLCLTYAYNANSFGFPFEIPGEKLRIERTRASNIEISLGVNIKMIFVFVHEYVCLKSVKQLDQIKYLLNKLC